MKKYLPNLCVICLCLIASLNLSSAAQESADTPAATQAATIPSYLGSWESPLVLGRTSMRLVFNFIENNGLTSVTLTSTGMGIYGMPADSLVVTGKKLNISITSIDMEFSGIFRVNEAGDRITSIVGDWFQHSEMVPVELIPVAAPTL
ncbi:MAG: hypothetical protein COC19_05690 [SAR86 cluster bacterium]|uniref:Uncharacterized protein n=1 Tax=SAR86 cluster bacterium TaxID=2030880 RepID=A0A2A4MLW9_9GAMM|nr:MAG: hypothetical protein COC19_05690 [SAR86 cluster bacterium]